LKPLSPTVVAAATSNRPPESLVASGVSTAFYKSLTVIRPVQR
jgi:hypothetical protein